MDWRYVVILIDIILIVLIIEQPWKRMKVSRNSGQILLALLFVILLIASAAAAFLNY